MDALFPDKFRTDSARRKGRGWGTPLSMLALPVAMIVPPFLFTYGQQETYVRMAIVAVLILVTVTIILLPGMWENKYLIDHYYLGEETRESFIQTLKTTIKQKSFMIYIVLFFGFQLVTGSLTGSVTYAARFVLRGTEMDIIWLFAAFLNGALISVPIWIFIAKKVQNNKKMAVLGGALLVLGTFSTAFYVGLIDSLIYMAILGFTMGNFWVLMTIYFADVLDERIVITKTDQRGATVGVQIFFGRFAALFQAIIFATIHILTGFPEGVTSWEQLLIQSPTPYLAAFGIRLHMSVIPAFVLMICTLVYWISFPLTQDKILLNKAKIKELGF